ncbi:MAG: polysaccharide deacetylase family protein [Deltaproteobacteria bacterium]|nr:polysaccharide deacetylase family protein [Deltaproteobacteria bacterium]
MALTDSRSTLLSADIPLFLIFLVVFSGCAGPNAIPTLMRPDVYRSDERILHRLKPGETPEILAEKYLGDARLAWMVEDANPKEAFLPDRFVVIPLVIPNRAGITDKGYQTVPILCYHRFALSCDSPLCMPADIFEQQIRYLKENGYRVIGPEALVDFLDYRKPIPKKAVMISVDDGYRSVYDVAYPILKKYGFTATLFIYIDYVGVSSQAITWDQLRELKGEGFYIGSHSASHSDLSKQKKDEDGAAYLARLKWEIFKSKQIIDEKLDQDTIIFSYPFGRRNLTVASLARKAGYKIAVTVDRGSNPFFADPFLIKRDQILKRDMDRFASRLKTFTNYPLE